MSSRLNATILHCHFSLSKKLPNLGTKKETYFDANVDKTENQNIVSTNAEFPVGNRLRLTQEQGPKIFTLLSSWVKETVFKFTVCLPDGNLVTTDHNQLTPLDTVDIASIPVSTIEYACDSAHLTVQEAESVAHPELLYALSQ